MEKLILLQQKIVPDFLCIMELRYKILRGIYYFQPAGRRIVAKRMGLTERTVRSETEFLRKQGLIVTGPMGMQLTEEGEDILWQLADYIKSISNFSTMEKKICTKLGLKKVIIVSGDSDTDETTKKEMGRAASRYLRSVIAKDFIIAVTGGTTMAEVAMGLPESSSHKSVLVVPARGGLGEEAEKQANTIAVNIAKKLGGKYRLLYIPDVMSEESLRKVLSEPGIKEVLNYIRSANVIIHGMGTAEEMAKRRGFTKEQINELKNDGAVGEVFGYYMNKEGSIVHATTSVGLKLEDLKGVDTVIAIGGGSKKKDAIMAAINGKYQDVLITDEGAARGIVSSSC